jgi:hypothetical protein
MTYKYYDFITLMSIENHKHQKGRLSFGIMVDFGGTDTPYFAADENFMLRSGFST